MSDRNKNGGQASGPGGQPDGSTPKKRRQRLPVLATLSLDDTLAANDHHPLGQSVPEVRSASRIRLIAAVLARMAQTVVGKRS